ncbi:MAG: hypothetical protein QS748_10570 [Candidatus Endonucleobacter bathymodioli]|uniref:Uncharacterized protein n=1 Tax=Candidatus Endonucleibacter bathymodioli TaxID=539814 RepID=A0AA90NV48_9GAMM|nr:hypothetical protein [Candidatus Endonucleobacter bathymodioli]
MNREANWNVRTGSDSKRKYSYSYKAHTNIDKLIIKQIAQPSASIIPTTLPFIKR